MENPWAAGPCRRRSSRRSGPRGRPRPRAVARPGDRQQRFERYLVGQLRADPAGSVTLDHLQVVRSATPSALADRVGVSRTTMTPVLDRLQHAGPVRREPHELDRREVAVVVGPSAARDAERLVDILVDALGSVAAHLRTRERTAVVGLLAAVLAAHDVTLSGQSGATSPLSAPAAATSRGLCS